MNENGKLPRGNVLRKLLHFLSVYLSKTQIQCNALKYSLDRPQNVVGRVATTEPVFSTRGFDGSLSLEHSDVPLAAVVT